MPHPAELDLTVHYYRPEHLDAIPLLTQDIFDNAAALATSVTRIVKWYNPAESDSTDFGVSIWTIMRTVLSNYVL